MADELRKVLIVTAVLIGIVGFITRGQRGGFNASDFVVTTALVVLSIAAVCSSVVYGNRSE
jgi:hypothetical protein